MSNFIKKLKNELNKKDSDKISGYEEAIANEISEIYESDDFYNLPIENIISTLSKAFFEDIDMIKTIIQKTISKYPGNQNIIFLFQNARFLLDAEIDHEEYLQFLLWVQSLIQTPTKKENSILKKEIIDAVINDDLKQLESFFDQEKCDPNAHDLEYFSLLHYCCMYGSKNALTFLVEVQKANIEARTEDGATPIMYACTNGFIEIVRYLVQHGCDVKAKDLKGKTVFHYAAINGQIKIIEYLVENIKLKNLVNEKDKTGKTALDYATDESFNDCISYLKPLRKH